MNIKDLVKQRMEKELAILSREVIPHKTTLSDEGQKEPNYPKNKFFNTEEKILKDLQRNPNQSIGKRVKRLQVSRSNIKRIIKESEDKRLISQVTVATGKRGAQPKISIFQEEAIKRFGEQGFNGLAPETDFWHETVKEFLENNVSLEIYSIEREDKLPKGRTDVSLIQIEGNKRILAFEIEMSPKSSYLHVVDNISKNLEAGFEKIIICLQREFIEKIKVQIEQGFSLEEREKIILVELSEFLPTKDGYINPERFLP